MNDDEGRGPASAPPKLKHCLSLKINHSITIMIVSTLNVPVGTSKQVNAFMFIFLQGRQSKLASSSSITISYLLAGSHPLTGIWENRLN